MRDLLVMKFGGTSMGSAERIQVAAGLCAAEARRRPVAVVVSAMSKVTDLLLETMKHAEAGDEAGLAGCLERLLGRHLEAAQGLVSGTKREILEGRLRDILDEFERIARGMLLLGERPPKSVDEAVAVGERLSAYLMQAALEDQGIAGVALNSREVVVTDAVFGNASPLLPQTRCKAAEVLLPHFAAQKVPVLTGFNGATADGRPTTLGRGGSDFSASIYASVLDASELWIWTDVDGIMSADPRLVPEAEVLEEITYAEAAELAYNGAKVLHPRTLAPLMEKGIPVWSKNSFAPQKAGTRIVPKTSNPGNKPRAVTSMSQVALVSMEPASPQISGTKVMARALESIAAANAELLAFSSSSYQQTFSFLIRQSELPAVQERIEETFSLELTHGYLHPVHVDTDVGLLAVVGEGMKGAAGLAGRIFTAVSKEKVNIIQIAQGSSELTIAIVVRRDGMEKAVRAIHSECALGH